MRDHRVGRTRKADAAGQRAGIDARNANLAFGRQPVRETAGGAEIAGRGHVFAHHAAHRALDPAFHVFLVHADIADVRESEGDDLPGIAGVGHHFLIAGHRGVEAHLADRGAGGAKAPAPDDVAIGQHQHGSRSVRFGRRRRGGVGHEKGAP